MFTDEIGRDDPPETTVAAVRLSVWLALAPPFLLALFLVVADSEEALWGLAALVLAAYGALLVALFAGARLGLAIAGRGNAKRDAAVAVVSAIGALAALLVSATDAFVILATALAAQGAWDAFGVSSGALPGWYGRLRTRVTFAAVAIMLGGFAATI
jgi:hypothetical protein